MDTDSVRTKDDTASLDTAIRSILDGVDEAGQESLRQSAHVERWSLRQFRSAPREARLYSMPTMFGFCYLIKMARCGSSVTFPTSS